MPSPLSLYKRAFAASNRNKQCRVYHRRPTVEALESRQLLSGWNAGPDAREDSGFVLESVVELDALILPPAPPEVELSFVGKFQAEPGFKASRAGQGVTRKPNAKLYEYPVASGPLVDLTVRLTDLKGLPLTSLRQGQEFLLHVHVEDLRALPHGVFAAYLDIQWDSALAVVTGPIQHSADYSNGRSGAGTAARSVIDEAGGFAWINELGAGPRELLSVPMRAVGPGSLSFTTAPADTSTPHHHILVYGFSGAVLTNDVRYGSTATMIDAGSDALASMTWVELDSSPPLGETDVGSSSINALERLGVATTARVTNETVHGPSVVNSIGGFFARTRKTILNNATQYGHDAIDLSINPQAVDCSMADL